VQIAISTESLGGDSTTAIQEAARLGFQTVEVNLLPAEFDYGYRRRTNARFYRALRKELDRLNLRVWSVTSPPLTQEQMFFERARKDILMSAAIAAGILGAQVLVVKPADIFTSEMNFESYLRDSLAPPVVEGYDEAWVQAVNRRMSMALRNHNHWVGALLTNEVDRLHKVTEDLAIGWAMDVPRALQRNDLNSWLAKNGDRLAVAYLYDQEEGRQCAPRRPEWKTWLATLGQTRLKCAVISAVDATTEELAQSRDFLLPQVSTERDI
jgi:hypothetical protein